MNVKDTVNIRDISEESTDIVFNSVVYKGKYGNKINAEETKVIQ